MIRVLRIIYLGIIIICYNAVAQPDPNNEDIIDFDSKCMYAKKDRASEQAVSALTPSIDSEIQRLQNNIDQAERGCSIENHLAQASTVNGMIRRLSDQIQPSRLRMASVVLGSQALSCGSDFESFMLTIWNEVKREMLFQRPWDPPANIPQNGLDFKGEIGDSITASYNDCKQELSSLGTYDQNQFELCVWNRVHGLSSQNTDLAIVPETSPVANQWDRDCGTDRDQSYRNLNSLVSVAADAENRNQVINQSIRSVYDNINSLVGNIMAVDPNCPRSAELLGIANSVVSAGVAMGQSLGPPWLGLGLNLLYTPINKMLNLIVTRKDRRWRDHLQNFQNAQNETEFRNKMMCGLFSFQQLQCSTVEDHNLATTGRVRSSTPVESIGHGFSELQVCQSVVTTSIVDQNFFPGLNDLFKNLAQAYAEGSDLAEQSANLKTLGNTLLNYDFKSLASEDPEYYTLTEETFPLKDFLFSTGQGIPGKLSRQISLLEGDIDDLRELMNGKPSEIVAASNLMTEASTFQAESYEKISELEQIEEQTKLLEELMEGPFMDGVFGDDKVDYNKQFSLERLDSLYKVMGREEFPLESDLPSPDTQQITATITSGANQAQVQVTNPGAGEQQAQTRPQNVTLNFEQRSEVIGLLSSYFHSKFNSGYLQSLASHKHDGTQLRKKINDYLIEQQQRQIDLKVTAKPRSNGEIEVTSMIETIDPTKTQLSYPASEDARLPEGLGLVEVKDEEMEVEATVAVKVVYDVDGVKRFNDIPTVDMATQSDRDNNINSAYDLFEDVTDEGERDGGWARTQVFTPMISKIINRPDWHSLNNVDSRDSRVGRSERRNHFFSVVAPFMRDCAHMYQPILSNIRNRGRSAQRVANEYLKACAPFLKCQKHLNLNYPLDGTETDVGNINPEKLLNYRPPNNGKEGRAGSAQIWALCENMLNLETALGAAQETFLETGKICGGGN